MYPVGGNGTLYKSLLYCAIVRAACLRAALPVGGNGSSATLLLGTDLGPTFIKFGQMLSIRPDVLPPPAVYELQKLCDAVPSYPTADALRLIEELGLAA